MGEFPNKATQFSKDRQPASQGRPKGSRSMKTMLKEFLDNISVETPQDGFIEKWASDNNISAKELMVLDDIKEALYGDEEQKEKSKKRIWEYLEGKPDQHQVLEVKQPQTKSEIVSQLKQYAERSGLTLQEYCEREGVDIATIPDDLAIDGNNIQNVDS